MNKTQIKNASNDSLICSLIWFASQGQYTKSQENEVYNIVREMKIRGIIEDEQRVLDSLHT